MKKNISGQRIKIARTKMGWTQTDLANKLPSTRPICRAGITKIELGERLVNDYDLLAFSRILKVSTDWLLGIKR